MADDDFDEEEGDAQGSGEAFADDTAADAPENGGESGRQGGLAAVRDWMNRRRSALLIVGMSMAMALFSAIIMFFRAEARPVAEEEIQNVRALAVEMLGHEVKIGQMYQLVPLRAGKRMTVGLDMVLVLGQLPEERVEGAPRPNEAEFELFIAAIRDLEPGVRSRVNSLLQKMPVETLGTVDAHKIIKDDVKRFVNDRLDGLDFGKNLRPGIGKRRVTEVLLPMYVRQML